MDISSTQLMTQEQTQTLVTMLERKYGGNIGNKYFEVETLREGAVLYAKVILRDALGKFFYPVEARINLEGQDITVSDARDLILDYIDAYFEEFLASDLSVYLPIDWANYDCDGVDLQMRGQILNKHLEAVADDLIDGKQLDIELLAGRGLLQ
jgi:hypothetical protein